MSWPLLYRMVCKDLLSDYTRICAAAAMPHNTSMVSKLGQFSTIPESLYILLAFLPLDSHSHFSSQ